MLGFLKKLLPAKSQSKQGFYFIHIPKTAGTSFINILDTCVAEQDIFPCQLWKEINKDIIAKKQQYKLLRGHFGGGAYKLLLDNKPHLLTILRHPQSLSISTFHFIKREKNTAVHTLVTNRDMDLLDFLQEPLTAQKINNRMVRHLSFDLQSDPDAQELFLSQESIEVVSKWIKTPKRISNQIRLIRAKNLLDQCSWFGIQEQFDKSMQLFAYQFNQPPLGKTAKLNSHQPPQQIDNQCTKLIAEQNSFDLELYSYAQVKFTEKYQQMCDELQNNFKIKCTIDNIDELIEKNYYKKLNHTMFSHLDYSFVDKLVGSGWHRREQAMPENSCFRWTSSSSSSIYFTLSQQNFLLTIRFINAVTPEHLDELQLLVNNQPLDYNYDTTRGVVRVLSANISQTQIDNNQLKLQFIHLSTCKHSDYFDGEDQRSLGIAINWIKITACKMEN
ncbi:MAG: sulfotransferase family 2 domain-containing protein [Proteobacteria bacterium]|nr:sulfotransferase family 2 domain-containing protein [Pseudomonadota bacterium]